jgi:hypothetical protein
MADNLPSADVTESGSLNHPEPSGLHRPVMGLHSLLISPNRALFVRLSFATDTEFTRIICTPFFPSLAAEKSRCVKYADFFCGGLDLGFILV